MAATPVWQVDEWTVAAGLDKIEQQWGAIRELLQEPALYDLRDPEVSGWSCGEHAGHLALVTTWIARGILENLERPDRDADAAWADWTGTVLEAGDFPRGVAQAPEPVDPAGRPPEDFLPVLPGAIAAWSEVRGREGDLEACPARFPHFALGYMTSAEWVRFCALHSAHHLAVVRDIRESRDVREPVRGS